MRALAQAGCPEPLTRSRRELDLRDQAAVARFFREYRPRAVFLAAARVGGILANNTFRWDFLYENLQIETNVIGSALDSAVERLVFFGSSCIYPKLAPQPIHEEYLLTGPLEPTNEPYAVAKIAGLKLVEAANAQYGTRWVSLMPTNLYGPGDNFDLASSHVLPAMIRKFHEAKRNASRSGNSRVELWGSGKVRREFLHVDDLARAALFVANSSMEGLINVGYGTDLTVADLADVVADVVGFRGLVDWDISRPDGTPQKLLDSTRLRKAGWRPEIELRAGIELTYSWYLESLKENAAASGRSPSKQQ